MNSRLFTGSGVALVTPFDDSGVNVAELKRQVERHAKAGTRAIIACGTTGEPSTMSIAERELAIRTCVEAAEGRIAEIIAQSNRAHKGFNTLRDRAVITGGHSEASSEDPAP